MHNLSYIKTCICLILSFILISSSRAQPIPDYKKGSALAFYFLYNDFSVPAYIHSHSLGDAFKNREIANIKNMSPGIAIGYLHGISNHIDFSGTFAGSSLDYPSHSGQLTGADHLLLELDASMLTKLFTDKSWGTPYVQAGLGLSKYQSDYGMFVPIGIGAQFIFFHDVY